MSTRGTTNGRASETRLVWVGSAGVTGLSGSYGPALNGKTGVLGRVCMAQPDFFGIVAAVLAVVLLMDIPVLWISGKQVPELLGQLVFAVFGFYFGRAHPSSPAVTNRGRRRVVGRRGDGEGQDNEAQPLTPPAPPTPSACSCCPWVGPGLGGWVPCRPQVERKQTSG